ncbi:MAG TPA: LysR family transcriptional regulator [Bacteriovoracaceae bacterium]|nr:LysR family transcriptional regulator [Bacteriovoracaceae bacterium]
MEIESIRIFVKVVGLGSYSKAALLLKLPKSTVSRTISRLEADCGTKLLLRTTRSLTLTSSGKAFYESCILPVQALEEAKKSLYGSDSILSGKIRLTASEDFGIHIISPAIGKLSKLHPSLDFEMYYTDKLVDLVKEGFDLAVRIGKLQTSSFKAKKLGEITMIAVATKEFLKAAGGIKEPAELGGLSCLCFSNSSAQLKWTFKRPNRTVSVGIQPRIVANQMTSLMNLALTGAGVALVPQFLCNDDLSAGRLVRVLPDWRGDSMPVSIVSPLGTASSVRLRLLSDYLATVIQTALSGH